MRITWYLVSSDSLYLLVSRVTFGLLMTLTFFVINHVGDVILISLALLTFLETNEDMICISI